MSAEQYAPILDQIAKHSGTKLEFRRALADCERLYRESAEECIRSHPQLLQEPPDEFVARFVDLHRGLLLKIFVEIACCDRRFARAEMELAADMLEHVWGTRPVGAALKAALTEIVQTAGTLSFSTLYDPFDKLPFLRDWVSQLETLVSRISNLVAKIDGAAQPEELRRIDWIQHELRRCLIPVPLEDKPVPPPPPPCESLLPAPVAHA
jgi:hypothetical protein